MDDFETNKQTLRIRCTLVWVGQQIAIILAMLLFWFLIHSSRKEQIKRMYKEKWTHSLYGN